ncbi:tetratricopeptide repeat protein [Seongchinamella unica]|uniref:Tetratricopeptide repeat protein n=1 Tax=Seongchinamella unica TaxID=2547392 RepID=A0A4R5LMZ3_9GAMM|nr:tetratricopeptide repeat protein [Seongchinamella unica]TDG11399.1 tetratricopeptide repeat protein [Seongchinamella unica]
MTRDFILGFVALWCFIPGTYGDEPTTLEYIDRIGPPARMEGVGNSHLEISTGVKDAQLYFDQGVSLLHDFWWFEAYRAFLHASELDPDSAMPHWGLYLAGSRMANLSKDQRQAVLAEAVEAMKALSSGATAREKYYLDAVIALHEGNEEKGVAAHNRVLLALLNEYPDEIEARLFLWTQLETGYNAAGEPKDEQLYGQLLLEREFEQYADHHGLLHYWIHSQEPGQHPESALNAAETLARLAPDSGHIVHMPGHIHYLMGNYGKAHEQFKKAEEADVRYMARYDIEAIFTWNYLHNFSFIMSNLAEAGRFQEGGQYADNLASLTEASSFRHLPHFEMLLGRAMMERAYMAMRLELFELAAELIADSRWDSWEKTDSLEALQQAYLAYCAGMAAVSKGEVESARQFSHQLDSVLWRSQRDEAKLAYRRKPLEIAALELQGAIASAGGDADEGIELLERAVALEAEIEYGEPRSNIHPAAETLAMMRAESGDFTGARSAYESVLRQRPNAGMPLYGIARSYELEGDKNTARKAYKTFLAAWPDADGNLPQVKHARAWLSRH